jgi:hypothetical protein
MSGRFTVEISRILLYSYSNSSYSRLTFCKVYAFSVRPEIKESVCAPAGPANSASIRISARRKMVGFFYSLFKLTLQMDPTG